MAQSLLCKVDRTLVKGYAVEKIELPDEKTFNGLSQGSEIDDEETKYVNQNSEAQSISFVGDWYRMYSNYPYYTIIYYNIDGTESDFLASYTSTTAWYNETGLDNISVPSGSYWCIRWSGSYQNSNRAATGKRKNVVIQISGNKDLYKPTDIQAKPKELKSLGMSIEIITFGRTQDGDFLFQYEKSEQTDINYSVSGVLTSNTFIVPADGYLGYNHRIHMDNNSTIDIYMNDKLFERRKWTGTDETITRERIFVKKGTKITYRTYNNVSLILNIWFNSY